MGIEMRQDTRVPIGIDAIKAYYGNPDRNGDFILDKKFQDDFLVKVPLPFPLYLSWNKAECRNLYGHKYVVQRIQRFFIYVADAYGGQAALHKLGYDIWGGCFQFRSKRGGDHLSTHAWGIAFDYLPHLGPYGKPSEIPDKILSISKDLGIVNGGSWDYPDGMHNQFCRDY